MERVAAGVNEGGREAAGLLMSLAALNNLLKLGPDSAPKSANFLQPGRRLMAEVVTLILPGLFANSLECVLLQTRAGVCLGRNGKNPHG